MVNNNYLNIIRASERDDYNTFCDLVDKVNDNNLIFMVLLEVGMEEIVSARCCQYIVDRVHLNEEQLEFCLVAKLGCLGELYTDKNLNYDDYVGKLKMNNEQKYNELMENITTNAFNFNGTLDDINTISSWLNTLKMLKTKTDYGNRE